MPKLHSASSPRDIFLGTSHRTSNTTPPNLDHTILSTRAAFLNPTLLLLPDPQPTPGKHQPPRLLRAHRPHACLTPLASQPQPSVSSYPSLPGPASMSQKVTLPGQAVVLSEWQCPGLTVSSCPSTLPASIHGTLHFPPPIKPLYLLLLPPRAANQCPCYDKRMDLGSLRTELQSQFRYSLTVRPEADYFASDPPF